MERAAGTGPPSVAQSWRTSLRTDLVAAMTSRDQDAVVALRTTIAAIDDAQAIEHRPRCSRSGWSVRGPDAAGRARSAASRRLGALFDTRFP